MEFSYTISEEEYIAAWKIRRRSHSRFGSAKNSIYLLFILACAALFIVVVFKSIHHPQPPPQPGVSPAPVGGAMLWNMGPFLMLFAIWLILLVGAGPKRLRRLYRNDPSMQGVFTIGISQTALSTRNTSGASSTAGWNIYEFWIRDGNLIVLVMRSGAYVILSLATLSDVQKHEVESILGTVLPKR